MNYFLNTKLDTWDTVDRTVPVHWHQQQPCLFQLPLLNLRFPFLKTNFFNSTDFFPKLWTIYKVMVKVTLVQALRLCTGRTAHSGSRGIALLFHDHGTRRGWGVSVTPRPLFTPGKDPVLIVQEAWWTPGPVWTAAENLTPNGIRSPDLPARSQSLYRLRYPAPKLASVPDI